MKNRLPRLPMVSLEEQEEFEQRRALLVQVRDGDRGAQAQLWQRYQVVVTAGTESF